MEPIVLGHISVYCMTFPRLLAAIAVILFLLLSPTNGYTQWVVQQVPTTERLTDVYFADTREGWVSSWSGIFHTIDGGVTWIQESASPTFSLSGINANECWGAGLQDTILHTTDGGTTWLSLNVGRFLNLDSVRVLTKVYFFDDHFGWIGALGWKGSRDLSVFAKTSDAGITWVPNPGSIHVQISSPYPLIQFIDHDYGVLTGYWSPFYRTRDGGESWDSLSYFGYTKRMDLQFTSKQNGWASSDGPGLMTSLFNTTDSGSHWEAKLNFQCSDLSTYFRFADSLDGWVAQSTCLNGSHTEIWHTSDGGSNWDLQYSYAPSFYFRASKVFLIDKLHSWIVGEHGIVLRTTNGGMVGVKRAGNELPLGYELSQNYPNPFNPVTTISFAVPSQSRVKITIFNSLGSRIKLLIDEDLEPGVHTVRWSGCNEANLLMASSVYLCEMMAWAFDKPVVRAVRKIVLLR